MAFLLIASPPVGASTHPVHAQHAIVVSVHDLASHAGVEILRAGGNAVDAAVATGFALAVVHPQPEISAEAASCFSAPPTAKRHFIDYREKAPAAATANMYLDAQGNVIPKAPASSATSRSGVPGSVAGLVYAEKKYGKLTLETGDRSRHQARP